MARHRFPSLLSCLPFIVAIMAFQFLGIFRQDGVFFTPSGHSRCGNSIYLTRILSSDPLIMHLENFVTQSEIQYLLRLA